MVESEGKAKETVDDEAEIAAFVKKWDLDARSAAAVRGLPHHERVKALAEFEPRSDTRNMSARFLAWLRLTSNSKPSEKAASALATEGPSEEELSAFQQRWSLEDESIEMVRKLTPDVQKSVLSRFKPAATTRDVTSKLAAFVKSQNRGSRPQADRSARGATNPIGADLRPAADRSPPPGLSPVVDEGKQNEEMKAFTERWSLNSDSAQLLQQMPADVRQGVMSSFKPPEAVKNVNALFQAFTRARFKPPSKVDKVKQFVSKWNLDEKSEELLRSSPQNVQNIVLREFELPLGSFDTSRKFAAFVRNITKRPGRAAMSNGYYVDDFNAGWGLSSAGQGWGGWDDYWWPPAVNGSAGYSRSSTSAPLGAATNGRGSGPARPPLRSRPSPSKGGKSRAFKWDFNEEARQALSNLPRGLREEILDEFDPPADTRDVSARFLAFYRRRLAKSGSASVPSYGKGKGSRPLRAIGGGDGGKNQRGTWQVKRSGNSSPRPPPGLVES